MYNKFLTSLSIVAFLEIKRLTFDGDIDHLETSIPSPGTVSLFIPPGGHGVRTDTAAFSGWKVPAHYDSLIAKVIVHCKDRTEALTKIKRALGEFIIEGIKTTIPFHLKILDNPDFQKGEFNTHFLDKQKKKK